MAAGCIPFVVGNGAPVEFVREGESGFQYTAVQELVAKTQHILRDPGRTATISQRAMQEARRFAGSEAFAAEWRNIANGKSPASQPGSCEMRRGGTNQSVQSSF